MKPMFLKTTVRQQELDKNYNLILSDAFEVWINPTHISQLLPDEKYGLYQCYIGGRLYFLEPSFVDTEIIL